MKQFLSVVLFWFMFAEISLLNTDERILIFPSPNGTNGNYLVKDVEESLHLTCVRYGKTDCEKRPMVWVLPQNVESKAQYSENGAKDSVSIFISHLEAHDSGEYKCGFKDELNRSSCTTGQCDPGTSLSSFASVHVFIRKRHCGGFKCSEIVCILKRYMCDGHPDCPNGADEHEELCGVDPCANKIKCASGRCIPKEWCCVGSLNCSFQWDSSCCPYYIPDGRSMRYLGSPQHYMDFNRALYFQQHNQSNATFFHDDIGQLNLIQSLIHTVIGCAMVFIVVGPILIIAGCRLFLRHRALPHRSHGTTISSVPTLLSSFPERRNRFPSVTYHPGGVSDEVSDRGEFRSFSRLYRESAAGSDILFANFEPVRPQLPPPYCEIMLPDNDVDPPPPYAPMNSANDMDELGCQSSDKPESDDTC